MRHRAGIPEEVGVASILLQLFMTSLSFMSLLLPFGRALTHMTGNASSIGMESSPDVGNSDNASEA